VGPSEAEPFWTKFLRSLTRRGLRGVKLVISHAHEGLKKATSKVLSATWQRCRVHFMRNALAHVGAKQRQMVAAAIRTAFTREAPAAAGKEWRAVADRLQGRFPKLGELMDEAEDDVPARMSFPKDHWQQIHSTNPLEPLNGEIKRRTDVVAIFPNEAAVVRLVGAMLLEQNDEWAVQRRYMSLKTLEGLSDQPPRSSTYEPRCRAPSHSPYSHFGHPLAVSPSSRSSVSAASRPPLDLRVTLIRPDPNWR